MDGGKVLYRGSYSVRLRARSLRFYIATIFVEQNEIVSYGNHLISDVFI